MDYVIEDILNNLYCILLWITNIDQQVFFVAKNFTFSNKKKLWIFLPYVFMQSNKTLGYKMEVTLPDFEILDFLYII